MPNNKEMAKILDVTPLEIPVMLRGKTGIGKTDFIRQYYEPKGFEVVPVYCSQDSDIGDTVGLPNRTKKLVNGI